jgi:phosphatidylserine/phosphatidylglycerophosphate/cardiolipin synthase-like enzyme
MTRLFEGFDSSGIESRLFTRQIAINGHPGYLHAKAIIVDGARGWVGSVNGSVNATSKNREFGVFFSDEPSVQFVLNWIKHDFTDAGSETWKESLSCTKDTE